MAYDVIFDNLYILSLPPQFTQTTDIAGGVPNFLANGGIKGTPAPLTNDPAVTRPATAAFIPDQQVPYSITYTLSYQREFARNYSLELRYLGTKGVHLLEQNRIDIQPVVTPTHFLPTFITAPTPAQVAGLGLNLGQLETEFANGGSVIPAFRNAGFIRQSPVVAFLSNGRSNYNGFSAQLTRRFAAGWVGSAAYTWSHLIDDTTAEVFSTVISPRRVENFQNLRNERADSALDHRHRFVVSSVYDLPFFNKSDRSLMRLALGGWSLSGTWSIESGEKATVRSGIDTNLNGDNAGDRTIFNPGGVTGTSSTVHAINAAGASVPLTITVGGNQVDNPAIAGYVADNPAAQFILARTGTLTNSGRNNLQLPRIDNVDFSVFKNFKVKENKALQFRVDVFNLFNHAQYVPGSVNTVAPVANTGALVTSSLLAGSNLFNQPSRVFSNNPRVLQMALRFNF